MQRLFSNFANGWPGMGLLLQRILTAILLIRFGIIGPTGTPLPSPMIPQIIAACAGIMLLAGLCTPIVGTLMALADRMRRGRLVSKLAALHRGASRLTALCAGP